MAETAIVNSIIRELQHRGAWVLKTHGTVAGRNGIPDIIACLNGRLLALEVKQPGRHPTPLQRWELSQIHAAGGEARTVTSVDQVRALVDDLQEAA